MIDYKKIEKFASMLEASLGLEVVAEKEQKEEKVIDTKEVKDTDNAGNQLDQRTDKEQAVTETPEPVLGEEQKKEEKEVKASEQKKEEVKAEVKQEKKEDDVKEAAVETEQDKEIENKTVKIAKMQRLIKLAKAVKKSKKLSAEEKEEALENIKKSAKKMKKADGEQGKQEEDKVIDRKMMSQQNSGALRKKIMTIYSHINDISKIKPNTRLSELGVKMPMTVDKLTFRWLINVLYDIVNK